jgi:hypothetical protein
MKESKGFGIASLVLSIFGLLLVLAPYFGIVFSILSIIFATIQKKRQETGVATAGLVMGIIGTVISGFILILALIVIAIVGIE